MKDRVVILAKREKDNSWAGTPMARLAMLTQGEQWVVVVVVVVVVKTKYRA